MNNVVTNSIIVVVLTLIVVIPIIIINIRTSRKRKERGFQEFASLCKLHKLAITNPDHFGHKLIGVDSGKKILLYLDNSAVQAQGQVVDLNKLADCRILSKNSNNEVNELGLEFEGAGGSKTALVFYKQYKDKESLLSVYRSKADEWQRKIKEL